MPGLILAKTTDAAAKADSIRLRWLVFVGEQGVRPEEERDDHDLTCAFYEARDEGGVLVATVRVRRLDEATAKIERLAVAGRHRRQGIATALLRFAIENCRNSGIATLVLNAQIAAIALYEKLGFVAHGDVFEEARIAHRRMTLDAGQ